MHLTVFIPIKRPNKKLLKLSQEKQQEKFHNRMKLLLGFIVLCTGRNFVKLFIPIPTLV